MPYSKAHGKPQDCASEVYTERMRLMMAQVRGVAGWEPRGRQLGAGWGGGAGTADSMRSRPAWIRVQLSGACRSFSLSDLPSKVTGAAGDREPLRVSNATDTPAFRGCARTLHCSRGKVQAFDAAYGHCLLERDGLCGRGW